MRVLICAAGVAGLTLAWCLERRGHDPIVVERAPHPRDDGYMIDFFGSGFDVAERLGLLPALESIHYPVDRLAFVNGRGDERFSVPYPALRKRLFANRHFNFMRGELERLLRAVGHVLSPQGPRACTRACQGRGVRRIAAGVR